MNNFLFLIVAIGFATYVIHYHLVNHHPAFEFGWETLIVSIWHVVVL